MHLNIIDLKKKNSATKLNSKLLGDTFKKRVFDKPKGNRCLLGAII